LNNTKQLINAAESVMGIPITQFMDIKKGNSKQLINEAESDTGIPVSQLIDIKKYNKQLIDIKKYNKKLFNEGYSDAHIHSSLSPSLIDIKKGNSG